MLTSYFKIALRYLAKSKVYSFINMAGLSLGLACVMLIVLYTKDEVSFDRFHKNVNSLYQIAIDVRFPDGSSFAKFGVTGIQLGPMFKANLPEIESYVRLSKSHRNIKLGENLQSQPVMQADSNFFSMLNFPLLQGNLKTALQQPNSVVLSQDMATRHFGTEDALNKTILFEREGVLEPYTVTGVAKRCPQNSSIQFDFLLPFNTPMGEQPKDDHWVNFGVNTLVRLSAGSDPGVVAAKMQQFFEKESKGAMDRLRAQGFTHTLDHQLQRFTDIHLSQSFQAELALAKGSNPLYSYILSGIAAFILIIACINFVNLTIARSLKRAKEIGIRKVVGSGRQQLIRQFLGESFLLCAISFVSAILLAQLLLPPFNTMTNKALSLSYLTDAALLTGYVILFVVTGLLAGFYPAIVLSSYNPVQVLYHQFRLSGKNYLQKGLVIFQFALATVMILATLTMYQQFDYLTTKDLGYDSNHILQVKKRNLSPREAKLFREELMKDHNIISVAPHLHSGMFANIKEGAMQFFTYEIVDEYFMDLLKLQILDGRNFSPLFPSDSGNAVVVNEAFIKVMGWDTAIGKEVFPTQGGKKTVVGVVKDYHYESLKNAIGPQIFGSAYDPKYPYDQVLIRIKPNSASSSIPHIESTFKRLFPMVPYSYQFHDEINRQNYQSESNWTKMILAGALLTIFIAGIGLLGLSILTAEKRFKEIGIRKVLGASVNIIVVTLSKDFLRLILLALLIAMPIAYYVSQVWLETYPYRTEIGIEIFVGAGLLVMTIALATIGYQSIKTALMNPVESLRNE
jgi:putative ABC transport system permease protein